MRTRNVTIARETLEACGARGYKDARGQRIEIGHAADAAREATVMHDLARDDTAPPRTRRFATSIEVTGETTLAALARLSAAPGGHLGCLNFASAKKPGGGFLTGAQAQEESLARSSALVPCLEARPELYERNRAHGSAMYLDLVLFSPRVPFFRDDDGGWLAAPVLASVVTAPAPNAGALRQHGSYARAEVDDALRRRGGYVLRVAAHHGIERLVLGAWGAGVFGNDPRMVADMFAAHLGGAFEGVFAEIVFAVFGPRPGDPTRAAFSHVFTRRS
jgi:uncharacterized protein (TIGR02452 family)